jgi:hypothetical protein
MSVQRVAPGDLAAFFNFHSQLEETSFTNSPNIVLYAQNFV